MHERTDHTEKNKEVLTGKFILKVSMALLADWNNPETVHWKHGFPVQIICISYEEAGKIFKVTLRGIFLNPIFSA